MLAAERQLQPLPLHCADGFLTLHFATPHRTASWAIVGGGLRTSSSVTWMQVSEVDLIPPVNPRTFLQQRLHQRGLPGSVGLLTSRRVDSYSDVTVRHGPWSARCIATVGLGNALRAGDLPGPTGRIGTINLVCQVSHRLSDEASLEALALCAEARTLALREAEVPSSRTGLPASGTGTDCVVVASPARGPKSEPYAGKHTAAGHVIGQAVLDATRQGVQAWLQERRR